MFCSNDATCPKVVFVLDFFIIDMRKKFHYNTIHTSSVPLYLLYLTFYAIQCVILFILYVDLCTFKNYKKLILWKYMIRRFEQDPTWLYFYLHISHNIQNKLERWIVPKRNVASISERKKYILIFLISRNLNI